MNELPFKVGDLVKVTGFLFLFKEESGSVQLRNSDIFLLIIKIDYMESPYDNFWSIKFLFGETVVGSTLKFEDWVTVLEKVTT